MIQALIKWYRTRKLLANRKALRNELASVDLTLKLLRQRRAEILEELDFNYAIGTQRELIDAADGMDWEYFNYLDETESGA